MRKWNILLAAGMAVCLVLLCMAALELEYPQSSLPAPAETPLAQVVFSELCVKNETVLPDEQGSYLDYIELYNPGKALDLTGYILTDGSNSQILENITLPADGYRVLFLGNDQIPFGLSAGGEHIELLDPLGRTVTQADTGLMKADQVLLWNGDGYSLSMEPSPGFPNTEEGILAFTDSRIHREAPLVIRELLLAGAGVPYRGSFRDVAEITNVSGEAVSTQGWYLSDGGDPYAYPLPEKTLAPGESLLAVCSRETTGFGLSQGETLLLTGPDFRHSIPVVCTEPEPGKSLCLLEDGSAYSFMDPSLGYPNTEDGQAQYAAAEIPDHGLVLSEVLADNRSWLSYRGVTCDWVELYNSSKRVLQLSDYTLSDDPENLQAYPLPDISLAPGEYCVIFLYDGDQRLLKGYPVLPFGLSAQGEGLYLSQDGVVEDYLVLPALEADTAWGRTEEGTGQLYRPTPEQANRELVILSEMPRAVTPQGTYDNVDYVEVVLEGEGRIYYTTDCEAPTTRDTLYTGPIKLDKTTVIRAICVEEGKGVSKTLDLTYIINEDDQLPVMSLVVNPKDFWGKNGIYTFISIEEERPGSISLFETDGTGFSSRCGVQIYGATSRIQDKKSMSVFFRNTYGAPTLEYPLFGEEGVDTYESFVLRAGGQDFYRTKFRDEMITSMVAEYTDVAVQKYRPAALYINGQYWGIYFIREKISEHYVAANYNVPAETVILTERNGGSCPEYQALKDFATENNMRDPENYAKICQMMDVPQYIDYLCAQIFIGNSDNSNVRFFTYEGGKWKWILYDTDLGMLTLSYDSVFEHLNPYGTAAADYISTAMLNSLLRNQDFKDLFLQRLAWQMNNIWTTENILANIDAFVEELSPDIEKDLRRWEDTPEHWERYLSALRRYARLRSERLLPFIQGYFGLSDARMREYGFQLPEED